MILPVRIQSCQQKKCNNTYARQSLKHGLPTGLDPFYEMENEMPQQNVSEGQSRFWQLDFGMELHFGNIKNQLVFYKWTRPHQKLATFTNLVKGQTI